MAHGGTPKNNEREEIKKEMLGFYSISFIFQKQPLGNVLKITTKLCVPFFLFHTIVERVLVCLCSLLLTLSGDVEINPGPFDNYKEYFSICHYSSIYHFNLPFSRL